MNEVLNAAARSADLAYWILFWALLACVLALQEMEDNR